MWGNYGFILDSLLVFYPISLSPVLKSLSCTEAILITVVVAYREQVKTPKDHDMTSIYQAVCSVAHCSKWDQKKNIPRYLLFRLI